MPTLRPTTEKSYDLDMGPADQPDPRPPLSPSVPLTGMMSDDPAHRSYPAVAHGVAGLDFPYDFTDKIANREVVGPYSSFEPNAEALAKLREANADLLDAVIHPNVAKAQVALAAGADPEMLVSVLDPYDPIRAAAGKYVTAPIAVAAQIIAVAMKDSGDQVAATQALDLVGMLAHTRDGRPRLSLGRAPDGSSQAVGFKVPGFRLDSMPMFQSSLEDRHIPISMKLSVALGRTCPAALCEVVPAADPSGIALGQKLPSDALTGYQDLFDPEAEAHAAAITRWRDRNLSAPDVRKPKLG